MLTRLETKNIMEILGDKREPPPGIIEGGVLLEKTLLLIYGKQKSRKSFLVYNMAVAISQGKSFATFSVPAARRVLVLSSEGGYYSMRDRIQKMFGALEQPYATNLDICFSAQVLLNDDDGLRAIEKLIARTRPEVLVLDPFVRFHSLEENSSTEMAKVMGRIRHLIETFHISVILVHHTGKNESAGSRGSSAIMGEYDSAIHISQEGEGQVHELGFEMRHVETPDPIRIRFNPETFWFDDPERNPVAEAIAALGPGKKKGEYVKLMKEKFGIGKSTAYKKLKDAPSAGSMEMSDFPPPGAN